MMVGQAFNQLRYFLTQISPDVFFLQTRVTITINTPPTTSITNTPTADIAITRRSIPSGAAGFVTKVVGEGVTEGEVDREGEGVTEGEVDREGEEDGGDMEGVRGDGHSSRSTCGKQFSVERGWFWKAS